MTKECYQLSLSSKEQSWCFKSVAGGNPCSGDGCLVIEAAQKDEAPFSYLIHHSCRNAIEGPDNSEFLERLADYRRARDIPT